MTGAADGSSEASVSGTGQVRNNGRITLSLAALSAAVIGRHYQVDFSLHGAAGTAPAGVRVFADSFAGGARSFPVDPTRSGYTFGGWNTRADGAGTTVTSTTDLTSLAPAASGPPSDLTLYAQWTLGDPTRDVDAFFAALADCTNTSPPLVITLAADKIGRAHV